MAPASRQTLHADASALKRTPEHHALGRALLELRARRGLSQVQLGADAGLHRNYADAIHIASKTFGPHDLKPKRGWRDDRTPWWCERCRVIWHGLRPGMGGGGCPQPRPHGYCGTILLNPRAGAR